MARRDIIIIAAIGFIAAISGVAVPAMVPWPWGDRAQRVDMPVIGFLNSQSARASAPYVTAFRVGLEETGYIEGRHVRIAYRWADGDDQKLTMMASELVASRVAVIAATGGLRSAWAVQQATSTVPALFISGADPVQMGLVASINRPGRNLTGVHLDTTGTAAKRLELLKELMASGGKVAMLVSHGPADGDRRSLLSRAEGKLAESQGAIILRIRNPQDFDRELDGELAGAVGDGVRGFVVGADPVFTSRHESIVALAAKYKLVAVYPLRTYVEAGGLASYGPDLIDVYRQIGIYTGRILNGARPSDLPVVSLRKWDLVINRKTAKLLRLAIPPWIIARANEIID